MQITEVEPEKKIVITKVQFSCDIIDESIPKPLFQNYNSFLILTAPPRSGKSTWITNMLCKRGKCYNRKFDSIYIVSPSLKCEAYVQTELTRVEKLMAGKITPEKHEELKDKVYIYKHIYTYHTHIFFIYIYIYIYMLSTHIDA